MPAKPRNNRVELRLTELEKKDWSEAAGGTRKLSDWIRAQCNAAARLARDENGDVVAKPVTTQIMSQGEPIIVAKPVIVEDAIRRSIGDQAHRESRSLPVTQEPGDDSKGTLRTSVLASDDGSGCPRWQHHRPGVYCGACKRVIAK